MTTSDARDRALDALLRTGPVHGPASPECLDAETLAAWVDRGLDEPAMQRAEAHVADCARCQGLMAVLLDAETAVAPQPTTAPGRPWWRFDVRWLMPLAGAATAVLLWMVLAGDAPEQRARLDDGARQVAAEQARSASSEVAAPPAASAPQASVPSGRQAQPLASAEPLTPSPMDRGGTAAAESAETPLQNERARGKMAKGADEKAQPSPSVADRAVAAAPPPVPAAPPAELAEQLAARLERPVTGGTAAAVEGRNALVGGTGVEIVSREPSVRWRVAGPRVVERSVDAGVSWTRSETGNSGTLTGGSSPSATVCWLVGREGLVLLTTDALTWQRLTRPTADDLVSVDATSERMAAVRTASGQEFRTTDAGATWTAVP